MWKGDIHRRWPLLAQLYIDQACRQQQPARPSPIRTFTVGSGISPASTCASFAVAQGQAKAMSRVAGLACFNMHYRR